MRTSIAPVLLLLHLTRHSLQAPVGQQEVSQAPLSGAGDIDVRAPPLPSRSLYELIHQRKSRGSSKKKTEQYHREFESHPDVAKINLNPDKERREETIRQLRALRLPSAGNAGKDRSVWNQKLTQATYKLLEDKAKDPSLLEDLKAINYQSIKEANKQLLQKRLKGQEGLELRHRNLEYMQKMREKRRMQRAQQSHLDKPLFRHLGTTKKRGTVKPTAKEVVERANTYRHMYSTGQSFQGALRAYLKRQKYGPEESSLVLQQWAHQNRSKGTRERYAKKRDSETQWYVSPEQQPTSSSSLDRKDEAPDSKKVESSDVPSKEERNSPPKSKKARIEEHLATSDWWKQHKL